MTQNTKDWIMVLLGLCSIALMVFLIFFYQSPELL